MLRNDLELKAKGFVFISIGTVMDKPPLNDDLERIVRVAEKREKCPIVEYTQGEEDICLYASLASTLH